MSTSWDDLRVIAVDGLTGETGLGIRAPFVKDTSGRVFVVRDVDVHKPGPSLLISPQALEQRTSQGAWLRIPEWPAIRCHVVMVLSEKFQSSLKSANVKLYAELENHPLVEFSTKARAFYAHKDHVSKWKEQAASRMIEHVKKSLAGVLCSRPDELSRRAENLERMLLQAMFATESGSLTHKEVLTLLGLLRKEVQPERLEDIAALFTGHFDGLDLQQEISRYRRENLPTVTHPVFDTPTVNPILIPRRLQPQPA